MSFNKTMVLLWVLAAFACNPSGHESEGPDEHEEVRFQYTKYTRDFELFADAEAFIAGETSNILLHVTSLADFKPVESGIITLVFTVNGNEILKTLNKPSRIGIYSFNIQPENQGTGSLAFKMNINNENVEVLVPEITVFASDKEAEEAAEKAIVSGTNTTAFSKEQTWKIDFSTDYPRSAPFGQVIKTTALVQSSQGNERVVAAQTNGIVELSANKLLEGNEVVYGQTLFTISGNNLAERNISVKYAEARSNFEKAKTDYERALALSKDKIVSEKDLTAYKNQFENTQAIYNNLNKSVDGLGQNIKSPMNGFVKQVFIKNGAYVEAGQPVFIISQNKMLTLYAEVPQKYTSVLGFIRSANIRTLQNNRTYTLEQLNGRVLSYGKAANSDNYLIPVSLQIDNVGSFMAGSFVEVYLKTITNNHAIIVPNSTFMEEQGVFFVWVQITPELFEKREVLTGATDGMNTEILQGINLDERIVTRGAMLIKLAQATGTLDAHSGHVH